MAVSLAFDGRADAHGAIEIAFDQRVARVQLAGLLQQGDGALDRTAVELFESLGAQLRSPQEIGGGRGRRGRASRRRSLCKACAGEASADKAGADEATKRTLEDTKLKYGARDGRNRRVMLVPKE